jgi:prevent-host-death family protein
MRGHTRRIVAIIGVAMEVAVRDLKDRLSEFLRRAQRGEEILVTSHGRPIVRIVGLGATSGGDSEAEAVARLRALPWVRAGDGLRLASVSDPIPPAPPGEPLLSELMLGDRE